MNNCEIWLAGTEICNGRLNAKLALGNVATKLTSGELTTFFRSDAQRIQRRAKT